LGLLLLAGLAAASPASSQAATTTQLDRIAIVDGAVAARRAGPCCCRPSASCRWRIDVMAVRTWLAELHQAAR
jgi:hypothetical protein